METVKLTIIIILLKVGLGQEETEYELPNITVQALKPKGVRISIPGDPRINLVYIEANHYRHVTNFKYLGTIRVFVVNATDGRWMHEDRETPCVVGDVFRCFVFVSLKQGMVTNGTYDRYVVNGFSNAGENFKITELEDPDTPIRCLSTVTRVYGKTACAGETILEDNFDNLREDLWKIEHFIPVDQPEHPFVSYQRLSENPTISIIDGTLQIKPRLQAELPGFSNFSLFYENLNLYNGCTNRVCESHGVPVGVDILPPIVSGRISSRVAFAYGNVEIRAKMPIGDWLYTEFHLEPFLQKYGTLNYASGLLKIATVCGNQQLNDSFYTNKVRDNKPYKYNNCIDNNISITDFESDKQLFKENHLYEPSMGDTNSDNDYKAILRSFTYLGVTNIFQKQKVDKVHLFQNLRGTALCNAVCRTALEQNKKKKNGTWSDEFHVYSVKWKPDLIEHSVDGKVWSRYKPGAGGLRSWMPVHCRGEWYKLLEGGGKMAPFDQHFFLSLGLAAGGTEFPDGLTTGSGRPKPWRNLSRKSAMNFWNDLQHWYPTWTQPLIIDYVRITAL